MTARPPAESPPIPRQPTGTNTRSLLSPFETFVRSESFGGTLLLITALIAFWWANSRWAPSYLALQHAEAGVRLAGLSLEMSLLHWVNDGLMAIFFLLVGLEIKRELVTGELADRRAAALPILAAVGGMAAPAVIFAALNWGSDGLRGWAIPTATDIAFSLGAMSMLGGRVPTGLTLFLTAVAIVDDLGAVLIIALFYTASLDRTSLMLALLVWAATFRYGRRGGHRLAVYLAFGAILWVFMFRSGVHATIAGVLLAAAVPIGRRQPRRALAHELSGLAERAQLEPEQVRLDHLQAAVARARSPLYELEAQLEPWVAYLILPVFALFNAGLSLGSIDTLTGPITTGAFLGLLVGKPIGIVAASWLSVRSGVAKMPTGATWGAMTGTGVLCGIGFTMSLFIAGLAFGDSAGLDQAKLGVLSASCLSALIGIGVLAATTKTSG